MGSSIHWLQKHPDLFEVFCYERSKDIGGQWNYEAKLNGDHQNVHSSQYEHMWINVNKESNLEYPDYTFDEHFGNPMPSYVPRNIINDYLHGRAKHFNLLQPIKFQHCIESVEYADGQFDVKVKNLATGELIEGNFDYVFNAAGCFWDPFVPEIKGLKENFKGDIKLPTKKERQADVDQWMEKAQRAKNTSFF